VDSNSKSRAAKNIVITGTAQAWRLVTGFLLTVVTTRLLAPSDFGILAMAATATALIALLKDLGISQAIIQRDTISHGQINSLFWVSIAASISFALLLGASAPLIARFYAEPKVELLTIAFAALVLIGGPQAVPAAILNRNSRFNELAIIDVASATTALAIGVTGALLWQSYWALYVSAAAATIVSGVGIWVSSRYRPGVPRFDANTAQMLRFGSHISGFNLVNYLSRNCDNILIGRFQGIDQLGLYDRAYRLLLFPITQLHGPMGQVLVPLLSRLQADPNRYRNTYAEAVSLIMIAAQPGILFAIICAPQLFELLFGDRWIAAAPIFQWLGIAALHQVMTSTTGWLFLSQGRGSDFFKLGAYGAVVTIASFVIGLPWGPVGVAASYTAANYVVLLPLVWVSTGRRGPVSCRDLVRLAIPHAAATFVAAAILEIVQYNLQSIGVGRMMALIALAYLVYACVILLFAAKRELLWRGARLIWVRT
jgi:polysaccharide transporter, PST family